MYSGPRRSSSEVAVLKGGRGTTVVALDRRRVNGGGSARYEILPGNHSVAAVGQQVENKILYNVIRTSPADSLCFEARPGRKYVIERRISEDGFWNTFLTDEESGLEPGGCTARGRMSAKPNSEGSAAPTSAASRPSSTSGIASSSGGMQSAPPLDKGASPEVQAALPITSVRSSTRPGTPATQASSPPEGPPPAPRPGNGFLIMMGLATGGDELAYARYTNGDRDSLCAGSGFILATGGMVTPLWIHRAVGLGVGAEIGWKYDFVGESDRSVSFSRFPLVLEGHAFVPLGETWFLRPAFGVHKELASTLSGEGASVDFGSPVGWMGEVGFYNMNTWHLGIGFAARFTWMHYTIGSDRLDANNLGANLTFHINP
jgi:hypothetical protein